MSAKAIWSGDSCSGMIDWDAAGAGSPGIADFPLLHLVSVATCYGRVDCLLERGRLGWERLRQGAVTIPVADAGVRVVARADAWALRRQFRE